MDAGGERPLYSSNVAVIREIYDSQFAHQGFAIELERALDAGCQYIVIEPSQLGEETARWIGVGNCLHKTAVVSGLGSLITGFLFPDKPIVFTPLGVLSLLCTSLYTVSWQFDNCVKYQVQTNTKNLSTLPEYVAISAGTPVVLVKKDDKHRKMLHCAVSLAAAAFCGYKLYYLVK